MKELHGVCVPVSSVFDETGETIDPGKMKAHVDHMLDAGVHIILANGGTGEFPYYAGMREKNSRTARPSRGGPRRVHGSDIGC
ncbi:MAG: hypothetical protein Ct9H300mP13_4270 [Gammaproteobacteria bacterium]|nr:MAG: hypothetical protein Ct9H300mP13_4270 [Gammaproteobacteria bacterium]